MQQTKVFEIFLVATPGLEAPLLAEAKAAGFAVTAVAGGAEFLGTWEDVWMANLTLRGAARVLARLGSFRAMHLAQLDRRSQKFPWADFLKPNTPLRVEVTCRKSRIYHAGAAGQRVEQALRQQLGATIAADAATVIKVRIEDDLCTISIDTTGEPLHKRGHKQAVGKAPMRETMAAMFLRECGYTGSEPVLDPMCGSGTFIIEAAEIALGLLPGRTRSFAFEELVSFNPERWAEMKSFVEEPSTVPRFYGSDRDSGAIMMSNRNAAAAGVSNFTQFVTRPVSDIRPPEGPAGLVIINPPYGARIGNKKPLFGLHAAFGQVLKQNFRGWRVGLVTSEIGLARATALPFLAPGSYVAHGGLKIRLYHTAPLA